MEPTPKALPYHVTREEQDEMVRLYVQESRSVNAVSAATGRAHNTVWSALRARGVMRERGSQTPVVIEEQNEMVRLYRDEGMHLRDIAKALHRSYGTVWSVVDRAGVQMRRTARPPGPREGGPFVYPPLSAQDRAEAIRLYRDEEMTLKDVSALMHRSRNRIRQELIDAGVEIRVRGWRLNRPDSP